MIAVKVNELGAALVRAALGEEGFQLIELRKSGNDRSELGMLDYLIPGLPAEPGTAVLFRNPLECKQLTPSQRATFRRFTSAGRRVIIANSVEDVLVSIGKLAP